MSDFVICVNDDWGPSGKELITRYGGKLPIKGKVYTIREVITRGSREGYRLEEIINPPVCAGMIEPAFIADQFRPVRDSDMDIFRNMLVTVMCRI